MSSRRGGPTKAQQLERELELLTSATEQKTQVDQLIKETLYNLDMEMAKQSQTEAATITRQDEKDLHDSFTKVIMELVDDVSSVEVSDGGALGNGEDEDTGSKHIKYVVAVRHLHQNGNTLRVRYRAHEMYTFGELLSDVCNYWRISPERVSSMELFYPETQMQWESSA